MESSQEINEAEVDQQLKQQKKDIINGRNTCVSI